MEIDNSNNKSGRTEPLKDVRQGRLIGVGEDVPDSEKRNDSGTGHESVDLTLAVDFLKSSVVGMASAKPSNDILGMSRRKELCRQLVLIVGMLESLNEVKDQKDR